MKTLTSFIALLTFVCAAIAGTNGGTAGAFARIGAGARAKALGNAYTGLAQGPSAVYFNPGALPFQIKREVAATTARLALDRRLDYLAFSTSVHPKPRPGAKPVNAGVGLGWLHAGVSDIDARDFDGNPLPSIDMSSNAFLFGFGIQFHEKFGAGVTAKVIYETFGKIASENRSVNGDGFGVDFGAFAKPIEHLSVGAQLKDVGTKTTWNTTDYWTQGTSKADEWPKQYRFGAAYERWGCLGALDIESSQKSETRLHAGVEGTRQITDRQSVAGRLGYDAGAYTFGVGLGFKVWKVESAADFTYVLEDIAPDDAVTMSFSVQF